MMSLVLSPLTSPIPEVMVPMTYPESAWRRQKPHLQREAQAPAATGLHSYRNHKPTCVRICQVLPLILALMPSHQRASNQLRTIKITRRFTETPAGSVLWEQGRTIVLCTASVTQEIPPWFTLDRPGGWITAEYVML